MLEKLFQSFRKEEPQEDDPHTLSQAVAALLVEAACADDEYTNEERDLIDRILQRQFDLNETMVAKIRFAAEKRQAEANDLYQFSRVVRDGLDWDGKMKLVEDMWRVVLSDEHRDPHEEMVIRRLVGLIHLEDRDSTEARRRAEQS